MTTTDEAQQTPPPWWVRISADYLRIISGTANQTVVDSLARALWDAKEAWWAERAERERRCL